MKLKPDLSTLPDELKEKYLGRLLSKISIDEDKQHGGSPCWVWDSCVFRKGYGSIFLGNHQYITHRAMYQLMIGSITEGLQLDHLCRVRNCCNPYHLEPVTNRENTLRGDTLTSANSKKTRCGICGGTYFYSKRTGSAYLHRKCRACLNKNARARKARKKTTRKGLVGSANHDMLVYTLPIVCLDDHLWCTAAQRDL